AIGLLVALVWGASDLVAHSRAARTAAATFAALAVAALAAVTARQVTFWQNPRALFAHALAVTHGNAVAEQGLGNALMDAGQARPAVPHLEAALRLQPDLPDVENTLGSALGTVGRYDEAILH